MPLAIFTFIFINYNMSKIDIIIIKLNFILRKKKYIYIYIYVYNIKILKIPCYTNFMLSRFLYLPYRVYRSISRIIIILNTNLH